MNTIQKFEKALAQLETQLNEANKRGVPLEMVMKNPKPIKP
jgi:exonuclease VII small subunit